MAATSFITDLITDHFVPLSISTGRLPVRLNVSIHTECYIDLQQHFKRIHARILGTQTGKSRQQAGFAETLTSPVVSLDDILKALSLHEGNGLLHAIQQGENRGVGGLPILVGLDHVFQVVVHTLQLGGLASLQCLRK